ncbi:FecR family protein [Spirochaeta cellobiosiphila]|uniref:FecR family protein n=1 Tax=Spirochaeta cellobiosiphila TaxID=504483 RepID=UPI000406B04A|nr:FecR family protein [Spirochaeta cellobiosiphila]
MRIKVLFLLLSFTILPLFAQVGEISYLIDDVELIRDGETYTDRDISFGDPVEDLDFFRTGPTGELDISLYGSTGIESEVHLTPNSTFYLEISDQKKEQKGVIQVLAGSVAFKVKKLTGNNRFNVQTETALMGVRGTSFEVSTTVEGDILITCEEGLVACTDSDGNTLYARPGTAVEKSGDSIFRRIPIAVSSLKSFRDEWQMEKSRALEANAPRAIKNYAARYEKLKREFDLAYSTLMSSEDVIRRWDMEHKQGIIGSGSQLLRDKKELYRGLVALRKNLFLFERVYFRLIELEDYYNSNKYKGNLRTGYTYQDFFKDFNKDKDALMRKMAYVRYINKLYAMRNEGSLPFDSTLDSDSNFLSPNSEFFN